ncbi:MAG: ankyrin repeat domain-containing protein [Rhodothermaceae bacterium]|nr:ankyrin repeat domain-containing protein [Rhodothermaceae bacterium]
MNDATRTRLEVDAALRAGDEGALRRALGEPPEFPNVLLPEWYPSSVLQGAIGISPLPFIRTLLELGADPNDEAHDGFPALVSAMNHAEGEERRELVALLLDHGADVQRYGLNDYTPLHMAVGTGDATLMTMLLERGADPHARTRIDDCATPLQEAAILGVSNAATEALERWIEAQP